jgi:hypothetical protein
LEKEYGLDKPALSAALAFGKDKPAQTLLIGKQRGNKPEYFARLADKDRPAVFVVKKQTHDALDQSSLAFRPERLWQLNPEEVTALKIHRHDEPEFRLSRDKAGDKPTWKLSGPFDAGVNGSLVQTMLERLAPLRCERYEAHTVEDKDLARFGLDKPELTLTVITDDPKDKTADPKPEPRVLLVGKPTAEGAETRFAKLGKGSAVFVVNEPLVAAVDRKALDLLDRSLLTLDTKAITQIKTTAGDDHLTLQRKDDAWQADTGSVQFPADGQALAAALGIWSNLRAQRFAAYGDKIDWAKYGLDKPARTITVTLKPANPDAKISKPITHTIALGKPVVDGGNERYARVDESPGVCVLSPPATTELGRTYLDFVERILLKLEPGSITGLARHMGKQDLELAKRDDGWHLDKPQAHQADAALLDDLVDQLAKLRAARVVAYPAKDLQPYGLDAPVAVLTLRLSGDAKPPERVLKIGKVADKVAGDRLVQVEGTSTVAVLPGELARRLVADPLKFRDRTLARFTDADRAILERGPRKATFAKIDGTWKLTEPLEAEAEQADLDDFINALARLKADELVAEKPASLKPYGLDRPTAHWRFQSGDKEVLNLLIGANEKSGHGDGSRCYAKLATGDIVFLLDPKLTTRVLSEYRNRTPWTSLDAAQVERVSYGYARNPFVLEKIGGNWQIAGKPDMAVKTETVNQALAALAGLRIERVVVDKDADLKLYGLEPPQLTLEVQTPTGKRVLEIGNREGESKRYYARVPDGKRSDVFVISEADAAKIVRDSKGFTAESAKPTP